MCRPIHGENRDRDAVVKRKERSIQVSAVPAYGKCLHLAEHLNLPTPSDVIAFTGCTARGSDLVSTAELVDLQDLLEAAR